MMRVRDCNRERVCGVRSGNFRSRKEARDHGMDLSLFCSAGSDHGLLNQSRGIFANRNTRSRGAHQNYAARLAKLERRLGVLVDENFFGRGSDWALLRDQ
jgi:hypothetical protein